MVTGDLYAQMTHKMCQRSDEVNPSVLPFPRWRHLQLMASHFVVVPIVIVPEFLPTNTVFNSELQRAPVVKVGGHNNLETKFIGVPVAGVWDICGQTVHKCDPVVQGVPQRDALLERQVQDAHEAGEAEVVRFHGLQKHFHLPDFLLKAW